MVVVGHRVTFDSDDACGDLGILLDRASHGWEVSNPEDDLGQNAVSTTRAFRGVSDFSGRHRGQHWERVKMDRLTPLEEAQKVESLAHRSTENHVHFCGTGINFKFHMQLCRGW